MKEKLAPIEVEERWLREEFLCTSDDGRGQKDEEEGEAHPRYPLDGIQCILRVCIPSYKLWNGASRKTLQRER